MLFTRSVIVETEHTVATKKVEVLPIAHGIITFISVFFPPGCHNQVNCVILHHEHQIAPSTENMTIIGDASPVEWNEYYESYQPPYELKLEMWGDDCAYDHEVTVRVAILPRKAVLALALVDAIKNLFSLFAPKRIFTGGG